MLPELFISYSRKDKDRVYPLVARLQRHFRAWIDKSMTGGESFPSHLAGRIATCAGMIVFLSPESVESDWVRREIDTAQAANRPVIPYLLTPCTPPPALLSVNYIPDADPDAFGKLIDSLNAKTPQARHHPGIPTDLHRAADADHRTFADTAGSLDGALQFSAAGYTLFGLPISFRRYHAVYLVGFDGDTLERQPTIQIGLQATGPFPGDSMPVDIADLVAGLNPAVPLRLILVRGMLRDREASVYDYSTDGHGRAEWDDAIHAVYWALTQAYAPEPKRVQCFIKAPGILALRLGIELAHLQKSMKFDLYHLDEDKGVYLPVFIGSEAEK
ncbi:MAG: toll/interleukin-1 receptor domain-containing protein [Anaerolineae bacterium]|nr:toll/interleukin-1 receptor domain-containing protein [Anaerolineae bacterium]NUQ04768.1 toll/interleukin-1 receptor domain-containing protein [Anaerolineae bacterium]